MTRDEEWDKERWNEVEGQMRQRLHAGDRGAADDQCCGADSNDQIEQSERVPHVR